MLPADSVRSLRAPIARAQRCSCRNPRVSALLEISERQGMNIIGGPQVTASIATGERKDSILGDRDLEADFCGHANCRFDRIVGDHSGHHEGANTALLELGM